MRRRIIGMALLGITCCICQAAATAEPKKIVTEFFTSAFVDRQPKEAALRYVSPDKYTQHNPNGKDGRESFINGFAKYVESTANARSSASLRSATWSLFIVTARRSLIIAAALSSTFFGSRETSLSSTGMLCRRYRSPPKTKTRCSDSMTMPEMMWPNLSMER